MREYILISGDSGTAPSTLLGQTFQLFDWPAGMPADDQFSKIQMDGGLQWDVSQLYTTGDVTLTAVPEPATLSLLALGGLAFLRRRVLTLSP